MTRSTPPHPTDPLEIATSSDTLHAWVAGAVISLVLGCTGAVALTVANTDALANQRIAAAHHAESHDGRATYGDSSL